ncbi:MAG: mechanosensitive ion channel family protein [Alistipes sp.]|nr:mechanosensitive ion channel family protein [Alistipes sp.]
MLNLLYTQTETTEPLLLPDSVQRQKFAEGIEKLMNLDAEQLMSNLGEQAIWILVKLLIALAFYFVGRWVIGRLLRILDRMFEKKAVDISVRPFIRNTVSVLMIVALLLVVVQTLGVNVTSLIAIFSAATLAIGMALSGTAQNFAGGIMILVVKPYRVGDYITAQGQSGTVQEIKLFSTVITTVDNQTIYIPNNVIATGIIDNYSTATTRRNEWLIAISYGDDVEVARRVMLDLLMADERVLKSPAPVVWVKELADSCVRLTVRAWVKNDDLWDVYFEYNERFYNELPKAGLHFPFPQLDIHVKNDKTA